MEDRRRHGTEDAPGRQHHARRIHAEREHEDALADIADQLARETDFDTFFGEAPQLHPRRGEIKGLICGYRVEEIADPFEQKLRQLDKLVDELAKGKALDKIKRA